MPTDFSALIDTVLVLAGLALVATGLVMFIYLPGGPDELILPCLVIVRRTMSGLYDPSDLLVSEAQLLQQDRARTGLFTAFPRRD